MKSMKREIRLSLTSLVIAAALGASVTVQAQSNSLPGTPVPAVAAERTIVIDSGTRWVNVNHNETVQFVLKDANGEQSFTWRFDAIDGRYPAKLSTIAPQAFARQDLIVYVDHNTNPLTYNPGN